jgi:hypothetical protein
MIQRYAAAMTLAAMSSGFEVVQLDVPAASSR